MIKRTDDRSVAVLEMRSEPANALDTPFADALAAALGDALADPQTTGVVLTGTGSVFSAGVNLVALLGGGADGLSEFLSALERLFRCPAGADKPLVACINGHAIAGGCVLALACDYRILAAGPARIGLPELQVGVPFPLSAFDIVRAAVPRRLLREVVLLGDTYGSEDAVARGLADEIVPATEALARSIAVARRLGSIPRRTLSLTKRTLASGHGGAAPDRSHLEREIAEAWADEEVRRHIEAYVERTLGKRG